MNPKKYQQQKGAETQEIPSLQAIIDHLIDNGMSPYGANMFIHINQPALGGDKTIMDCVRENNWAQAWATVKGYLAGDYF